MKIFSNFDSKQKETEYKEAIAEYWENSVILINRHRAYLIMRWIIPFLFETAIITLIVIFILEIQIHEKLKDTLIWILIVIFIIILYKLFNVYLSYKFDYTLVNPNGIIIYRQLGIFNSKLKDLPTSKIRSMQAYAGWILGNLFWYWTIEVYTSLPATGGELTSSAGKKKINYIRHPVAISKQIIHITQNGNTIIGHSD